MKLLFENWRKMLEAEVRDIPTNMNMAHIYSSYKTHLGEALSELTKIKDLFEKKRHDIENIQRLIELLEAVRDDESLKFDMGDL